MNDVYFLSLSFSSHFETAGDNWACLETLNVLRLKPLSVVINRKISKKMRLAQLITNVIKYHFDVKT